MNLAEHITTGFAELKNLLTSKAALEARLTAAETAATEFKATIARQETELAKAVELLNTANAGNADLAKTAADSKLALEASQAEVARLTAEAKTTAQRAVGITSAQGIPAGQLPGAAPAAGSTATLESVQNELATETDPKKRAILARKCRELRGHGNLFGAKAEG